MNIDSWELGVPVIVAAAACGPNDDEQSGNEIDGGGSVWARGSMGTALNGGSIGRSVKHDRIQDGSRASWAGEGELVSAVLELVVDLSGSVEDAAPGSRDSKWSVTRAALLYAVGDLDPAPAAGVLLCRHLDDTGERGGPRPITECVRNAALPPIAVVGAAGSAPRAAIEETRRRGEHGQRKSDPRRLPVRARGGPRPRRDEPGEVPAARLRRTTDFLARAHGHRAGFGTRSIPGRESGRSVAPAGGSGSGPSSSGRRAANARSARARTRGRGSRKRPRAAGRRHALPGPDCCHLGHVRGARSLRRAPGPARPDHRPDRPRHLRHPPAPADQVLDPRKPNLTLQSSAGAGLVSPDDVGDCTGAWRFDDRDQVVLCSATCDEMKGDVTARVRLLFGCVSGEVREIP